MLDFLLTTDAIFAILTFTFLEIILGIDNIVFISIAANKLPETQRSKATNIGLLLAMVQRIILLFFVSFLCGTIRLQPRITQGRSSGATDGDNSQLQAGNRPYAARPLATRWTTPCSSAGALPR